MGALELFVAYSAEDDLLTGRCSDGFGGLLQGKNRIYQLKGDNFVPNLHLVGVAHQILFNLTLLHGWSPAISRVAIRGAAGREHREKLTATMQSTSLQQT